MSTQSDYHINETSFDPQIPSIMVGSCRVSHCLRYAFHSSVFIIILSNPSSIGNSMFIMIMIMIMITVAVAFAI